MFYAGQNLKHHLFLLFLILFTNVFNNYYGKIDDFHCTYDGESCKQSHGATNC